MRSDATTVDEYLGSLPEDCFRRVGYLPLGLIAETVGSMSVENFVDLVDRVGGSAK